jgi:hypothetical protein
MEGQLWGRLYPVVTALGKAHSFARKQFGDACIVLTYLWAVLHDRPVCWACDPANWPAEAVRWRPLPSPATMSRRLRTAGVLRLLAEAEAALRDLFPRGLLKFADAKPLPVGGASKDPEARPGRAVRGVARGYKLHAVWDAAAGVPDRWCLASMNANEVTVARRWLFREGEGEGGGLPPGGCCYVVADNQYDCNDLYDLCGAAGAQLLVAPRQGNKPGKPPPAGLGHRAQSPRRLRSLELARGAFGRGLLDARRGVEQRHGLLGNFGGGLSPLPNWVRRIRRVFLWVAGKILVYLARKAVKEQRLAA